MLAAAVVPFSFIAWQAAGLFRNVPFQDEFATVLDFLLRTGDTHTWRGWFALIFDQENEHRIVTSRLIFLGMRTLTGGVNFIAIAILGDLFIVAAIAVIAWQERCPTVRLLSVALLSLLVFQMQHYENLFLSYASIDHFHIVLLGAISLALLSRGTARSEAGAVVFALLASFTLAHGLALFPAGAVILILRRRWVTLGAWTGVAAAAGFCYLWGLQGFARPIAALHSSAGWEGFIRYWLALLGGVPALGAPEVAPVLGAAAIGAACWLARRGACRREPFLCALALWAFGATLLISYGRFGSPLLPPSSSRYMVQSALLWGVLGLLLLKEVPPRLFPRGALVLLLAALGLNVAADLRFKEEAEVFLQHRRLAVRHYLRAGTLQGAPFSIYPDPLVADRLLAAARRSKLYDLGARVSSEAQVATPVREKNLDHCIDELTVGKNWVFVRGWLLPPLGRTMAYEPYLILQSDDREFVFRGERVSRPDVAEVHQRPSASDCGFRFDVPRSSLPKANLNLSLALVGWDGTLRTSVVRRFDN